MKVFVIILALFGAGYQPANTAALPAALRTHVQADRFGIVTSIRGLPLGVRDELQTMFGHALDIADPDARFQGDTPGNPAVPSRRLVAAGCSRDHHCLVHYQRGGTAVARHVMLFQWTPSGTQFEWGGDAARAYATIEDLRTAILAGEIKSHTGLW